MILAGWILSAIGLIGGVLAAMAGLDTDPDSKKAMMGFVMLALPFAVPGSLLLIFGYQRRARRRFVQQLLGFVRARDAFTPVELGQALGTTPAQGEATLVAAIAEHQLDLAFHRPTGRYLHRGRIKQAHRALERCEECGAQLMPRIVFANETDACEYCGKALA